MDQAADHAAGPGARLHLALGHHLGIDARHLLDDVLELQGGTQGPFLFQQPLHPGIDQHPLGVAQGAHDQAGIELRRVEDGLFHVLVDRGLLRGDEAGAHVHPVRAEGQRGHEGATIGHSAGGKEGDLQFLCRAGQQDEVRHVILARVAAALEAVDAHRVAADGLCLQGVTDGGALVDHLHPRLLQAGKPLLRVVAGGLDDLHAPVDDGLHVARIVRRGEGWQEGQVHAERLVRHLAALGDLGGEQFGRALGQAGDDPHPSGIGDRRGQFCQSDIVHAALHDGVFDAEQVCDAGLHGVPRGSVGFCRTCSLQRSAETLAGWRRFAKGMWRRASCCAIRSTA